MENKNYSKDVMLQGVARIVGAILSFVAVLVLTYFFDESAIGEYNLILSTVNMVVSICTLWLSQSILRFYQEEKEYGSVFIFIIASALLSIFGYTFSSMLLQQPRTIWIYIYILVLVMYNSFDAIFRRCRKLKEYVILELSFAVGRIFPMIIIASVSKRYESVFASQSIIIVVFLMILLKQNWRRICRVNYRFELKLLIKYLKYGVPLMGLSISNWFLTTSDRYIIKHYSSSYNVGIYSQNYSLANSIYMMFALILINAFHPIIMQLWEKSKKETIDLVSQVLDMYFLLMIPITFYGCLKAPVLLQVFQGDAYASHSDIFCWTAVGIFFYGVSLLYHKYYEVTQNTHFILFFNILAAVINIVLNYILIPILGFEIAAFTTFISYAVYILVVRVCTIGKFKVTVNFTHLTKIIVGIGCFYCVDRMFVHDDNFGLFLLEGIIFVVYILGYYKVVKLFDVVVLIKKVARRRCDE